MIITAPLPLAAPQSSSSPSAARQVEGAFADMLREGIASAATAEAQADHQVRQLHGGGGGDLHEVMLAMEQADISLRLLVSVRNKALEAYQEIMRIQV